MVLGSAERVSTEMETTHECEGLKSLSLAHDLLDQGGRLPAPGGQQDSHAGSETADCVLQTDGAAHVRGPIQGWLPSSR